MRVYITYKRQIDVPAERQLNNEAFMAKGPRTHRRRSPRTTRQTKTLYDPWTLSTSVLSRQSPLKMCRPDRSATGTSANGAGPDNTGTLSAYWNAASPID
jgi:hypothetical protein